MIEIAAAHPAPLRLPTREIQRKTGLSAGSLARAAHGLEQRNWIHIRRGFKRSVSLAYEPGPSLLVLLEQACANPCSTVEQPTLDLQPCSTTAEHFSTPLEQACAEVLQPSGASPVDKCSSHLEQAPNPCSSHLEQAQTVVEQAQLAESVAHAAAFADRLEQAPSIDRILDRSIDRSMLQRYRTNGAAAQAALDRVVSIGAGRRFGADEIETARTWLMGYMAANPPRYGEVPQQPPDDNLVRQFLCIAAPEVLRECLLEMHRLKKAAGNAWAWFVTVAMQQLYGVRPDALRRKREEARAARKPSASAEAPAPAFAFAAGGAR